MYTIKVTCDPYNARTHYNGQKVIKFNGSTPVEWIAEEGFQTMDEAKDALMRLAMRSSSYVNGNWSFEDEESVRELAAAIKEDLDDDEEPDMSWFKGPGIYDRDGHQPIPVLLEDETSFRDDVESYSIEEAE